MINITKDITNLIANADGKNHGLSQKDAAKILKMAQVIIATDMLATGKDKAKVLFDKGVKRNYNKLLKVKK